MFVRQAHHAYYHGPSSDSTRSTLPLHLRQKKALLLQSLEENSVEKSIRSDPMQVRFIRSVYGKCQ